MLLEMRNPGVTLFETKKKSQMPHLLTTIILVKCIPFLIREGQIYTLTCGTPTYCSFVGVVPSSHSVNSSFRGISVRKA